MTVTITSEGSAEPSNQETAVMRFPPHPQTTQGSLITMAMYSALASNCPECANAFMHLYREPADQSPQVQIAAANQFWRMQFACMNVSTISVREYLQDNCEPQHWIRHFAVQVAPVAVAFQLPRSAQVPEYQVA